MIEVDRILADHKTAVCIEFGKLIDLLPEAALVDSISVKEGRLHISGDERFVEIPDTGYDILTVEIFIGQG